MKNYKYIIGQMQFYFIIFSIFLFLDFTYTSKLYLLECDPARIYLTLLGIQYVQEIVPMQKLHM